MEFRFDLLEETKKEIKKMSFFENNIHISEDEYEIIHDFEQAMDNAFNRYDFEYNGCDGQTWVDILEENESDVWEIIYQNDNYAELSKIITDIKIPELDEIKYNFQNNMVKEEMKAELELCVRSRVICGKDNSFFEDLFKVYCLGGWPCGWNNGKIIVYVPEDSM